MSKKLLSNMTVEEMQAELEQRTKELLRQSLAALRKAVPGDMGSLGDLAYGTDVSWIENEVKRWLVGMHAKESFGRIEISERSPSKATSSKLPHPSRVKSSSSWTPKAGFNPAQPTS